MTIEPLIATPLTLCIGARATLPELEATLVRRCRYVASETTGKALSCIANHDVGVIVAELGPDPGVDSAALLALTSAAPQAMLVTLEQRGSSGHGRVSSEHVFRRIPWPCARQRLVQAVVDGLTYHLVRRRALDTALPGARCPSPELLARAAAELLLEGRRLDAEHALRPFLAALLAYCQAGSLPLLNDVRTAIDMALQLAVGDAADEWIRYVFDLHSTLRLTAAHDVLERLSRIISSLPRPGASSS